jgi:L-asparaginase
MPLRPTRRHLVQVPAGAEVPRVALLTVGLGDEPLLVEALPGLGYAGLVIEATGGGHVPRSFVEPLARLAERIPVVYAARTGSGEVLRETYGFPGSEHDLRSHGMLGAGMLDGLKARVLLTMLLATGADRGQIDAGFVAIAYGG